MSLLGNIAFGHPTFQSSTSHGAVSSRAVDGDKNTAFSAGSCTHTLEEDNPWWSVDLLQHHLVGEVHLTNRDHLPRELRQSSDIKDDANMVTK